jgi:hypothetical protein
MPSEAAAESPEPSVAPERGLDDCQSPQDTPLETPWQIEPGTLAFRKWKDMTMETRQKILVRSIIKSDR